MKIKKTEFLKSGSFLGTAATGWMLTTRTRYLLRDFVCKACDVSARLISRMSLGNVGIIALALDKNLDRRFQTGTEMARALRNRQTLVAIHTVGVIL
jgi:hypothetical protein